MELVVPVRQCGKGLRVESVVVAVVDEELQVLRETSALLRAGQVADIFILFLRFSQAVDRFVLLFSPNRKCRCLNIKGPFGFGTRRTVFRIGLDLSGLEYGFRRFGVQRGDADRLEAPNIVPQARNDLFQRGYRIIVVGQQIPDRDIREVLKAEEQPQIPVAARAPDPVGEIQQCTRLRFAFLVRGQRAERPAFLLQLDQPCAPEFPYSAFGFDRVREFLRDPFVDKPFGMDQRRGQVTLTNLREEPFRAFLHGGGKFFASFHVRRE